MLQLLSIQDTTSAVLLPAVTLGTEKMYSIVRTWSSFSKNQYFTFQQSKPMCRRQEKLVNTLQRNIFHFFLAFNSSCDEVALEADEINVEDIVKKKT